VVRKTQARLFVKAIRRIDSALFHRLNEESMAVREYRLKRVRIQKNSAVLKGMAPTSRSAVFNAAHYLEEMNRSGWQALDMLSQAARLASIDLGYRIDGAAS